MATIIKAQHLWGQRGPSPRPFNLADYEAEAARLVEAARRKADQLLGEAAAEAAAIREEARARGHREGVAQGLEEGRRTGREQAFAEAVGEFGSQRASLADVFAGAVAEFEEKKQRLLLAARADVIELALAIARRVMKRRMEIPEEARASAVENAAEALALVTPQSDAVLRVNPGDREAMERFAGDLLKSVQERRHVRVISDSTIAPGGCVITTAEGQIDATPDTQLDRIADLLVGIGKRQPKADA